MSYLAYTVFHDLGCTQVRCTYQASGATAEDMLRVMRRVKGSEPREGDIIAACRVDRIGSEDRETPGSDRETRLRQLLPSNDPYQL